MNAGKSKLRIVVVIVAALTLSSAALGEEVFVQQPSVVVRAGKGAVYEEVATVKKGDKLTLIAREGKWLRVSVGGKEGYIFENSVGPSKSAAGLGGLSSLLSSGAGTGSASDTAAGRGLGESLDWARGKNMSPAGLNRMLTIRKGVTPLEWERFVNEGRVGPAKQ